MRETILAVCYCRSGVCASQLCVWTDLNDLTLNWYHSPAGGHDRSLQSSQGYIARRNCDVSVAFC